MPDDGVKLGAYARHGKDPSLNEQFFEFIRRYEQSPGEVELHDSAPWLSRLRVRRRRGYERLRDGA